MYKKFLLLQFCLLLCLGSCVGDVDFASGYEKKVVVNCVLKNRDIQHLSLTYNKPLGSNADAEKITEAKASLWNADTDTKVGEFEYNGEDWTLSYTPSPGVKYRLKIDGIEGQPHIEAETEYPLFSYNGVDYPSAWDLGRKNGRFPTSWVSVGYYENKVFHLVPNLTGPYITSDGVFHENSVDRFNETEKIVTGKGPDGKILHYPVYRYLIRQFDTRDLKEGESGGYGRVRYSLVPGVPRDAYYYYLIYPSEEYDRYLKELITNIILKGKEDDILTQFDERLYYSNIKNGLGIFSACEEYILWDDMWNWM